MTYFIIQVALVSGLWRSLPEHYPTEAQALCAAQEYYPGYEANEVRVRQFKMILKGE